MGEHSSVGIATRYGLGGLLIESWWSGGDFSDFVQTGPGPIQLPVKWTLSFLTGVRRTVPDHPPPSKTEVKEREELYLYPPPKPSWGGGVIGLASTLLSHYVFCLVLEYQDIDVHTERQKQPFPATNSSSKLSIYIRHGYYNKRHFSQLRLATRHIGDRNSITERGSEFPLLLVTSTTRPASRFTHFLIEGLFPLRET